MSDGGDVSDGGGVTMHRAQATNANAVVVSGLYKSFGTQPVLTGVDLSVPAGSFTAILGPSGSGKTTLLRVLAGFERADRGTVSLGGTVVDDGDGRTIDPEHRRIGYVSQEGSLFPHLDVEANVGFGLPRRERHGSRVGELLDAVGLGGLGRRYPHQLSGGQQQRVAVARALAIRPAVVLLDEPFASLDAHLRSSVRSDVKQILAGTGTTAILVTHDQDEALSLADLVAVIREGRIAQCAPPHDIYASPVDPELSRFVGEANLVEGTVHGEMVMTGLGELAVTTPGDEGGRPLSGRVRVMVRPEQLVLGAVDTAGVAGVAGVAAVVRSSEYFGHDTIVVVRAEGSDLPELVARITGGTPPAPGSRVSLRVSGGVVAWPLATTTPPLSA